MGYVAPAAVSGSRPEGVQYTLTASAAALSASSLLDNPRTPARLTVKNSKTAADPCYLGGSGVTNTPANAWIELAAGESFTFQNQAPSQIYIVGTVNAANIAFIVAEYGQP